MVVQMVNNNHNASVHTTATAALPAPEPLLALQDGKLEDSQESLHDKTPSVPVQSQSDSSPVSKLSEELKVQVKKAEMKQQTLKPACVQKPKRKINEVLSDLKKAFAQDNAQRKERKLEEVEEAEKPEELPKSRKDGKENGKPKDKPEGTKKKPKKEPKEEKKKKTEVLPSLEKKTMKGKIQEQMKEKTEKEPKQLKMDRKCYTSRAYHRTYQEVLKKNGDKEEAKLVAKQALREASKKWEEEFGNK